MLRHKSYYLSTIVIKQQVAYLALSSTLLMQKNHETDYACGHEKISKHEKGVWDATTRHLFHRWNADFLFFCDLSIIRRRHAVGIAEDSVE